MSLVVRGGVVLGLLVVQGCGREKPGMNADGGGSQGETVADTGASDGIQGSSGGAMLDPAVAQLIVHLGADVPPVVAQRIVTHLESVSGAREVVQLGDDATIVDPHPDSLVFAVGDTSSTRTLIADEELAALGSEAFILRSGTLGAASLLATDGNALADGDVDLGVGFGAYAALEALGFAFLHPLEPTPPLALPMDAPAVDAVEQPHWPIRGLQLHTMHPLELTDLLQGWGPGGPDDAAGWEAMLPEWDAFLEWMLANRQNHVHWVLLSSAGWEAFADGPERIARLSTLVDRGHAFGVRVGVDAPIALHQQNAWRLVREQGTLEQEIAQIQSRIDHLMGAGFDYLATESGTTEFTSVDGDRMLAWMDAVAAHVEENHGRPAYIKAHASTGQTVEEFADPDTGEPINFNFLPHHADARLGVLPHTVQHYGLLDPAPTYGNTDFAYMRAFLHSQVGRRSVVWHPETAYWVSFDIDVPLFLPVYAERRLADLRLLGADEQAGLMGRGEHAGGRMDGQMTFSSGWEWGYWLGEVVTARASWNPHLELDDEAALAAALDPVVRSFGDAGPELRNVLIEMIAAQNQLLIRGLTDGSPEAVPLRNGQAYLQGFETWDDVSGMAGGIPGVHVPMTQPDRLGLVSMRNPLHGGPGYSAEIEPLLAEMEVVFTDLAQRLEDLEGVSPAATLLHEELVDAAWMTALRAVQVHALYDYVDGYWTAPDAWRQERLATARAALDEAMGRVAKREAAYRVEANRIASWRPNPTAYDFGYLWSVRNLFYWWRDEGKAVDAPVSPCYMNVIDPVLVGFGEGRGEDAAGVASDLLGFVPGLDSVAQCLDAPSDEPSMPPPGLR